MTRSKLYGGNLMRAINALGERCGEVQRKGLSPSQSLFTYGLSLRKLRFNNN